MNEQFEKSERKLGKEIVDAHETPIEGGQKCPSRIVTVASTQSPTVLFNYGPGASVSNVVRQDKSRTVSHILTREEVKKIFELAGYDEILTFYLVALMGLRSEEMLHLTVECVESNFLRVPERGEHEFRRLPIVDEPYDTWFYHFLDRDWSINQAWKKNPHVVVPEALLIYEQDGVLFPLTKERLNETILNLSARSGINFDTHTLRRTCVQNMIEEGASIEYIAHWLGHHDLTITRSFIAGLSSTSDGGEADDDA